MANNTLDLDKEMASDRQLGIGHGTDALGPSDRSDSGSDMTGIVTFDSDTDSVGTGERASVEPEGVGLAGEDIDADQIEDDFLPAQDILDEADANAVTEDDDPLALDADDDALSDKDKNTKY